MKLNNLVLLALLAVLTACNTNSPSNATQPANTTQPASSGVQASTSPTAASPPASVTPVSTQPDTAAPTVKESDAFPAGQYQIMLKKVNLAPNAPVAKVKLAPAEQDSYRKAAAAAGNLSHVHADVKNGQLAFSADKASEPTPESHITGNEPQVSGPNGISAKKIVPTPEALRLLQARAAQ